MPPVVPPPPRFLYVQVNQRCNLKCGHCKFWERDDDDRPNYLPWPRMQEILGEFREMNPSGRVVICGGEPMLDLEEYFALTGECLRLGLRSLSVVNGTKIQTASMADRMVQEGPDEVSISLDGADAEVHDRARGVHGSFHLAVTALRLLLDARRRHPGRTTRIYAMGLVFDETFRDLDAFYHLVLRDIGADKLKLNFLQPSFGEDGPEDEYFARHHLVDPEALTAEIARCDEKYRLGLNPVWLEQVGMYFESLNQAGDVERGWRSRSETRDQICNTYERNIMVDHYGMARLCFSTAFRGEQLTRPGDLRRFWETSEDIRGEMRGCKRFCGISHSVRRESSSLASSGRAAG